MDKVKPISLLIAILLVSVPSLTVLAQDSDEEESEDESTDEDELTYEESTTDEDELSDEGELTYVPADEPEVESTDEEQSTTDDDYYDELTYVPTDEEPVCDPSYPDDCIAPPPPELNCGDDGVPAAEFRVLPPDPHGFDDDNDGLGCESNVLEPTTPTTNLSNNTTTTNTTNTTNSNPQESITYNFKEVTFQGSHGWTSDSDGFQASTTGSFHPTSSFDNPERAAQIEGTGRFDMTAHKKTGKGDNCLYEIRGNYGISGKVKYDNNTSSEHPKGILDVDSILIPAIYAPLKEGPKNACGEKYGFGYSPMLICNEPVTIDVATKRGINERHREGENEVCTLELSGSKSPPAECPTVPESASAQVSAMVPLTTATEGNTCPSPNNPSIAVAKWSVVGGTPHVGMRVTLDGSQSYDPDLGDTVVAWKWTKISRSDSIVENTLTSPSSSTSIFKLPDYVPAQFTSRTTLPKLLPIELSLEVVDNHGMKSTNTDTSKVSIDVECHEWDTKSGAHAVHYLLNAANIPGAESAYPQTVDNFRYFLSGGGDTEARPKTVSGKGVPDPLPIEWLENTMQFHNAQIELVSQIQKDIEKMLKEMKIGETRALPFDGSDGRYNYFIKGDKSVITDFEGAVGDATAYAYPHLEVTKKGRYDLDRVSGDIRFKLPDTYDFNKGMEFEIPIINWFKGKVTAHDLHNAIKCFGARNFDQTTTYKKIITEMPFNYLPQRTSECSDRNQCRIEP